VVLKLRGRSKCLNLGLAQADELFYSKVINVTHTISIDSKVCRIVVKDLLSDGKRFFQNTEWPKKVSHYQVSSLNRIKNCHLGQHFHQLSL